MKMKKDEMRILLAVVDEQVLLYGAYGSHGIDHEGRNEEERKLRMRRLERTRRRSQ